MNATPLPGGLSPDDRQRPEDQRLDDLLADRAVFGLDAAETAELARMLAAAGATDDARYDLAAAQAATALTPQEPLPRLLRERVLDDAAERDLAESDTAATSSVAATREPSRREWPVYTIFAVAAGLLISLWLGQPPEPTAADLRRSLVASAPDLVQIAWAPQKDASLSEPGDDKADYGDVVWSDKSQRGYLRFKGLRPNDPKVEQYQLWVFDAARDDRYPVDGGVFDIPPEGGEHVVAIDARLRVEKAVLFAITVEKPGGVVVSDRKRLPLLAKR